MLTFCDVHMNGSRSPGEMLDNPIPPGSNTSKIGQVGHLGWHALATGRAEGREVKKGASVRLESFSEADFDQLIAWSPSPEFLLQWAGPLFTFPLDRAQLEKYLAACQQEPPVTLAFRAMNEANGEVIGHAELSGIDRRNRSARLSRVLVGPEELRGQGFGQQVVEASLKVAFETLKLHRVDLFVFDFNRAAIGCYARVGFKHEGILRDARRHEEGYWSVFVMSILEHEGREVSSCRGES
jgi:RimJ/RimL family protein N-acetyltransferase